MKKSTVLALALILSLPFTGTFAQPPVGGFGVPRVAETGASDRVPERGLVARLKTEIAAWNAKLQKTARDLARTPSWALLLTLSGISLVYGVLHAAGPGHGKTVLSSFVLTRGLGWRSSLLLAWGTALMHILVSLAIVGGIYAILRAAHMGTFFATSHVLTIASGVLITGLGAWFLWKGIRHDHDHSPGHGHDHSHPHDHDHDHDHDHSHDHAPSAPPTKKTGTNKEILLLIGSAGIVPCPGPISVLLLTAYSGALWAGLLSALLMAVGMGATYTVAVLAVVALRRGSEKAGGRFAETVHRTWEIGGSLLVMAVGILVLLGALTSGG